MAFEFVKKIKNKVKSKIKNNTLYQKYFGFESGIDITDDKEVQYRKNVVIKNIIFVSNMVYTVIFFLVSLGNPSDQSNWLLTVLLFPVTFLVNYVLKKLINKGSSDALSQTLAMYVGSFYMFLSTIIIYIKLKYGSQTYLAEVGYILIYYSLLICAFYQNRLMLKNVYVFVIVLMTVLHFLVTYPVVQGAGRLSVLEFVSTHSFLSL